MFLKHLKITNFKNYVDAEFHFSSKLNCFIGDNGAGKTNILDAIYYLSFCKSYFNSSDNQNILHGAPFFSIHGSYQKNGSGNDTVSCIQKRNQKKLFKINDKDYDRLSDHIGLFPLVMISPNDRDLINEGSEMRRKYVDLVISQFDKIYLNDLISYNKALLQRNLLLKQFAELHYFDNSVLEIWDEQLIRYGEKIHSKRKEFLDRFMNLFQHYFNFITDDKEKVGIQYFSQLNDRNFDELLAISLENDRITKFTNTGIHKDDLIFLIDDYPVKKYGSQGQQKSFVVAIKLAQFDYTKNINNFKPILLLDDIFDKLDDNRVRKLIQLAGDDSFGQAFITDTKKERVESIFREIAIDHKLFRIFDGCHSIL